MRSGWPRRVRTSSRSTSAPRSTRCPIPMATPDDLAADGQGGRGARSSDRGRRGRRARLRRGPVRARRRGWPSSAAWTSSRPTPESSAMPQGAELDEQTWQDIIDTNLTGVWHTAKAAIPHIRAGGRGGSIVLTSSAAGIIPYPQPRRTTPPPSTGSSGLMKTLALELAPDMIRVNTVNPTSVHTPMVTRTRRPTRCSPGGKARTRRVRTTSAADPERTPTRCRSPWVEPVDISNAVAVPGLR